MKYEIFGPIPAIVPVDSLGAAIRIIHQRPTPLVIYVFSESSETKNAFATSTASGSIVFNDTVSQLAVYEMPFGGQGETGYGGYLGKHSFDEFVHKRGSITVPLIDEPSLEYRYPPYAEEIFQLFNARAAAKIPDE